MANSGLFNTALEAFLNGTSFESIELENPSIKKSAAWRSAKSVIVNASQRGISLQGADGKLKSKKDLADALAALNRIRQKEQRKQLAATNEPALHLQISNLKRGPGVFISHGLLSRLVASKAQLTASETARVLKALESVVSSLLDTKARVRFMRGYLMAIDTKSTRRRQPGSGKLIDIPARTKIVFRPSRSK
jgi:nucleoid DNA-binding protein